MTDPLSPLTIVEPPYDPRTAARFWSRVVKGPSDRDCWIYTGAVADDAYGRFWVQTPAGSKVVRPHRYVYELITGERLEPSDVIEHAVCDNPICVRFAGDEHDHLLRSTQAANLARMGRLGRGGGHWLAYRMNSTDRASLAARSRRLRAAVLPGWNAERIREALTYVEGQPPLF